MIAAATLVLALQTTPARDGRGPVRGTAVISGLVVSDDADARPVPKARVTCSSPDVSGHTTITDAGGRFVFTGLPAGRYMIGASKTAWVTTSYGAKRPLRPGVAIPLGEGQKIEITVRMARGSVITGVVLDHNNQPSASTAVIALRPLTVEGERRLVSAGFGISDDRGIYRIFGLAPGDYLVSAAGEGLTGPELRLTSDADVRHALSPNPPTPPPPDRTVSIATTYYPGGTLASQAGLISLRAGEERGGVDLTLEVVPTARVEGTVFLPEGGAPQGTQIDLTAVGQSPTPGVVGRDIRTTGVGRDGSFSFANIPPGQYRLRVHASRPVSKPDGTDGQPQTFWGSAQIAVDGEPVTGVAIALEPALTISGRVRFEGTTLALPADLKSIRVNASPVDSRNTMSFPPNWVNAGPDGRFSMADATPGRYRLTASLPGSGRPGGWLLKSIVAGGQDALDSPFTLQPNQHVLDATITFTDRLAQISGRLQDASGGPGPDYTVVLFPEDPRLWSPQSRRIQGVRPSADGAYAIRNLPAGTYLIAPVDDVEPGEWFDPAFLQRLAPGALRVTIADGEWKVQDVRLGSQPKGH